MTLSPQPTQKPSPSNYAIYRDVISRLLEQPDQLPSLPALTIEVRKATTNPNTTYLELANLIRHDPSLCALVIKHANRLHNKDKPPINTLEPAITHLGFDAISNIVMLHSISSLFTLRSQKLRRIFSQTWKRLAFKACIGEFLSGHLHYTPKDEPFIASLLSDIGRLGILSAFKDNPQIPQEKIFSSLFRDYTNSVGSIMLQNWHMPSSYIYSTQQCGKWSESWNKSTESSEEPNEKLALLDVVNLAHYHTELRLSPEQKLPPLETLAAFKKIPAPHNEVTPSQQLKLFVTYHKEFKAILRSMSPS